MLLSSALWHPPVRHFGTGIEHWHPDLHLTSNLFISAKLQPRSCQIAREGCDQPKSRAIGIINRYKRASRAIYHWHGCRARSGKIFRDKLAARAI